MAHTVLVADDSQTIRQIVGMALKASQYQLVEAHSAHSAIEAIQQRPDIILLDYYMPDGSGYDICRAVKNNASTCQIPVIMMGGTYKNFDEHLARQAGADEVVWKPFSTDQLMNAIEAAASRQRAPAHQPAPPQRAGAPGLAPPPPNPFAGGSARPGAPPAAPQAAQPPRPSGSQPRIPTSMSQGNISRAPQVSSSQDRIATPPQPARPNPGASQPGAPAGQGFDPAQVEEVIRAEVQKIVREELPGMIRNVMGELFNQKILPRLLKHSEDRVTALLNEHLNRRVQDQVRVELERLLSEE